jgi:hypothetical protein
MKPTENKFNIPPVHNPELEKVIKELKQGNTPENQAALIEALKKASLLSPCDFDVKLDPNMKMPKNFNPQQIKFFLVNTKDGKTLFPTFTDIEMSQKFNLGPSIKAKYVVQKIKDYDTLLSAKENRAAGIVINPGTDDIVIPAAMIAVVCGRNAQPMTVPQGTAPMNVTYTEPSVYPTKMVNAVYDKAEQTKEISRIWLKGKFTGPVMSFYLAVEADKHDESVLNAIREVAVPLSKGIDVEVAFITPEFKEKVIGDAVALYDKDLVL